MKTMTIYDSRFPAVRDLVGSVYRADPFEMLDRIFETEPFFSHAERRAPLVDVREEESRYLIEAELPGLSEKDIRLEIKDGLLSLATAEKQAEEKQEGNPVLKWLRRERREFRFARSFELPEDADAERVEARFRDGLLSIELPKLPKTPPRIVPVRKE